MPGPVSLDAIEKAVSSLLEQEASELVDLRYVQDSGRWVLRVFVDKHGGVTVGDCEYLSQRIGALLDTLDAIPHAYSLEVSSPGLDRVLKKERDFLRFMGHRAKLRLRAPLEGQRRFAGCLQGMDGTDVLLESAGRNVRIPLASIEEARLDPEIKF